MNRNLLKLGKALRLVAFSVFLLAILCGAVVAFVIAQNKGFPTFAAFLVAAAVIAAPSLLYIFLPSLIGKKGD